MSSDFYFKKWQRAIAELETLVNLDIEYQVTKAHDQTECQAVHRLSGVLGQYIAIYNDAVECLQQNLQVQKTRYLKDIVSAVVARIIELKRELQKLEGSSFHFFGKALVENKLTIDDVDMHEIPEKIKRLEYLQSTVEEALQRAKEKREALAHPEIKEVVRQEVDNWWLDGAEEEHEEDLKEIEELPEEVRKTREMVALIQAHEKSRQTISILNHNRQKRVLWEKELTGTLQPRARHELRERGAKIIQNVLRVYFEIKRQKIAQCKRDEKLGINICKKPNTEEKNKLEKMLENRSKLHDTYEEEWKERRANIKERYLNKKRDAIIEDYRDQIRYWFQDWFERVQFIYDIPKDGSAAIVKGDIPEPEEWFEEYNTFLIEKQANKGKSAQQKKFDKLEAKKEQLMLKREEKIKKKAEEALLKKMMKNPTLHPGYNYPQSNRTDHIIQVIGEYHRVWDHYDVEETLDVKQKYVEQIDVENTLMEAKLEVLPTVDEQMRAELHTLKIALKEYYTRNDMKMPEQMTKNKKGKKKKKTKKNKVKDCSNQKVIDKIEELAVKGFIKDYPKTKIEDFIGDPNFAGEDLRCNLVAAFPFHNEVRAFWWEKCGEVIHGFHKILLIGPKGSGKTRFVHALASANNAILFELDPIGVQGDFLSAAYLQLIVQDVVACARAVQPSVIHVKHVEKLFYSRVPPEEAEMSLDLIKNFFIQKLFKRVQKTDNITVIGTCVEPWVTKSKPILKQFPTVLLLPNTNYSVVLQMLKKWAANYNVIQADFNVSNLAYVLQGYSFGYLTEILEKFMTADRIAQIAAHRLSPMDVYNYLLEDNSVSKIEYDKYLKWYMHKTNAGKKEAKHLQDQREFKLALEKYANKMKNKKANKAAASTSSSKSTLV